MKLFKKLSSLFVALTLVCSASLLTSCAENGTNIQIPGVDGPKVSLFEDKVLIQAVFTELYVQGGLTYYIPKYPHSYIEVTPDLLSAGTIMTVTISLKDLFSGVLEQQPAQALPGGRPLPGIVGGRLPAIAFSIPQFYNLQFYIGERVFGLFIPVKLNMPGTMLTARFYNDGKRAGNMSLVGEDADSENSGFLLMLDLGPAVKSELKRINAKYK